jgi:hypothetical protein
MKTKLELSNDSTKPSKTKHRIRTKVRAGSVPWAN